MLAVDPSAIVDSYLHALSAGDADGAADCVTPDFSNEHTSALGSNSSGQDEYRRRVPGFLAQFAGLQYEVLDTVVDGNRVVVRYRLTANFEGHPLDIPGAMWFEVRDGLIARRIDHWDSLIFLRQTGAVEERHR